MTENYLRVVESRVGESTPERTLTGRGPRNPPRRTCNSSSAEFLNRILMNAVPL